MPSRVNFVCPPERNSADLVEVTSIGFGDDLSRERDLFTYKIDSEFRRELGLSWEIKNIRASISTLDQALIA